MKKGFWEYLKQKEVLPFVILIILAISIDVLGIFADSMDVKILVQTILLVFASTIALLLMLHKTISQMHHIQIEAGCIDKFFKPENDLRDEIIKCIRTSSEIWLLSRTGQGWWRNYKDIFLDLFKKEGENRFLFIDPGNGALKMILNSAKEEWEWNLDIKSDFDIYQKKISLFLSWLCTNFKKSLEVKTIDYLPAYALLISNPNNKNMDSVIWIFLATFRAGIGGRPVCKVTIKDSYYFEKFFTEFNLIWNEAKSWNSEQVTDSKILTAERKEI